MAVDKNTGKLLSINHHHHQLGQHFQRWQQRREKNTKRESWQQRRNTKRESWQHWATHTRARMPRGWLPVPALSHEAVDPAWAEGGTLHAVAALQELQ